MAAAGSAAGIRILDIRGRNGQQFRRVTGLVSDRPFGPIPIIHIRKAKGRPGHDLSVLRVIKTGHLVTRELEQNQSKRALAKSVRGGFSLRKKPLGMVLSGYSYSGFAVAERLDRVPLILWNLGRFPD